MTADHSETVRRLRVVDRRELTGSIIELAFESEDGSPLPEWEAGAHVDLRLGADLIRQYSLVRSTTPDGHWRVAVLIEPGGRGGSLKISRSLRIGSSVDVSGPRNHFPLEGPGPFVFVAGGIGITPVLSLARQAETIGAEWRVVYLGRRREDMAYLDELSDDFGDRLTIHVSGEHGRLDLAAELGALAPRTAVYACGPEGLMEAVEEAMADRDDATVHVERFHPKAFDTSANQEFTVYAVASDVEFVVPEDESVLMAADFEGIVVPGDCLEGTCGSCETRVLLGEVEHRDSVLTPAQRAEGRTMMICVSRAAKGCGRLELDL